VIEIKQGERIERLTMDAWEAAVTRGAIGPQALVRFAPVTGRNWVQAQSLEMYTSLLETEHLEWKHHLRHAGPPLLTAALIGFQVRVWWLCQLPKNQEWASEHLTKWGAPILEDAEVYRLFTMGLLHVDLSHLAMNMIWLGYTGIQLERALGWKSTLTLYTASVWVASLFSTFGTPAVPSLGASGGVFGLISACVVFGFARSDGLPPRFRRAVGPSLLPYMLLIFFSGLSSARTDNWAHFGGLVAGGLLVPFLLPPKRPEQGIRRQRALRTMWGVMAVGTFALALFGPRLTPLDRYEALRGAPSLSSSDAPTALAPATWKPARSVVGKPGLRSPEAPRSFAVRRFSSDEALSAEALYNRRTQTLRERTDDLQSAPLNGGGKVFTYRIQEEAFTTWYAVEVHGLHAQEREWTMPTSDVGRLAPLRDRVWPTVTWQPSFELTEARAAYRKQPTPSSARTLAAALADEGAYEEALELLASTRKAPPSRTDDEALLQILKRHPQASPHLYETLDEILTRRPAPYITVAAAEILQAADAPDLAETLLTLAWWRSPGDITLQRLRVTWGLSTRMTPEGQPVERQLLPTLAPPTDGPLTVALASQWVASLVTSPRLARQEAFLHAEPQSPEAYRALYVLALQQPVDPEAPDALAFRRSLSRAHNDPRPRWVPDGDPAQLDAYLGDAEHVRSKLQATERLQALPAGATDPRQAPSPE